MSGVSFIFCLKQSLMVFLVKTLNKCAFSCYFIRRILLYFGWMWWLLSMVCLMRQFLVAPPGHVLSPIRGNEHKVGVNFTAGNSQFPFSSPPQHLHNAPPLKNDKDNDVVSFHTLTSTNSPLKTFLPKKFPLSIFFFFFVSLYFVFFLLF